MQIFYGSSVKASGKCRGGICFIAQRSQTLAAEEESVMFGYKALSVWYEVGVKFHQHSSKSLKIV